MTHAIKASSVSNQRKVINVKDNESFVSFKCLVLIVSM